jgi:hypothetical protein
MRGAGGGVADIARHTDAMVVLLDLDFGEAGIVEKLGKLADQLTLSASGLWPLIFCGHQSSVLEVYPFASDL